MAKIQFVRENHFVPNYEKDKLEIEKEVDGSFTVIIDEPIHGMTDNGMTTSWNLSKIEVKLLADFLLRNMEN